MGEVEESAPLSDREWLAVQFESLTTDLVVTSPSAWAEAHRYLPPSVTSLPGVYRFDVAPFLREIVDCLSIESPVREVALMKGVQVCATTGILENAIGYYISHVRTAPVMLVTADSELAKLRMESYVTPMLQMSGLMDLVKSTDETNTRKTGKTDKKLEWVGGGFLIPFGAQNANKLRSISIRVLLRDEIDGWPDIVGKDGDPIKLSADRTAAYEGSRKILDLSTPLIKNTSKIAKRFAMGDQRYYHVCCLRCGFPQVLRWKRTGKDGEISGIVWDMSDGKLVPGSVRYLCENCQHPHSNDDKTRLLAPEYGAEWRPSAVPSAPDIRSYHLSALYSPVGMQTWEACVRKWLDAWDIEHSRTRDMGALQVFYNNVLGEPFEVRGEKLRFESVSSHRRQFYTYGEIPNRAASEFCGSSVLALTCAVDVHKTNLAVAVWGWCRDRRAILVSYERFEGDADQLDDANTWGRLREMIETREFIADDGKRYRIQVTLIDSGYSTDSVYRFCADYVGGVFPSKGREAPPKGARVAEFSPFTTPMGQQAYGITVDIYKDRWHSALRRQWDGQSLQPDGHFNAPMNATDAQLKELTVETKRERIDKSTGQRLGFEWHRPSGANNELWDLLVYGSAAFDIIAWDVCTRRFERDVVEWQEFYKLLEQGEFFTTG